MALAVIEVGRHGDHGFIDRGAQVPLGGLLHLFQDFSADLRRGFFVATGFNPSVAIVRFDDAVRHHVFVFGDHGIVKPSADQPLDRKDGIFRVGDRLPFGGHADQRFTVFGEGHHGWGGPHTFLIFDDAGILALHHRDTGIGSS